MAEIMVLVYLEDLLLVFYFVENKLLTYNIPNICSFL